VLQLTLSGVPAARVGTGVALGAASGLALAELDGVALGEGELDDAGEFAVFLQPLSPRSASAPIVMTAVVRTAVLCAVCAMRFPFIIRTNSHARSGASRYGHAVALDLLR
jgi:hypothetical protein